MKLGGRKCKSKALMAAVAAVGLTTRADATTYTAADTFSLSSSGFSITKAAGIFGTEQVGSGTNSANNQQALLWNSTVGSFVDLNPVGFTNSFATGIYGTQQVGYGKTTGTAAATNALMWAGTSASFVNLNPSGFTLTHAMATNGSQQVGDGIGTPTGGNDHALLWSGSAASHVDLNPSGYVQSEALSISGTQEVGEGSLPNQNQNALLWFGTTAGFVNLNPSGFTVSIANGNSGSQQVGSGYGSLTLFNQNAILWTGSASSAIDLNPTDFTQSEALATNSVQQVGDGFGTPTGSNVHAIVWNGSASQYTDLNSIIPGSATFSFATGIDLYGNVSGFAQTASSTFAVEWLAGDTYSTPANGTAWNSAATWLSGVPTTGNDIQLISSDGANRTITYANSNSSIVLGTLTIDALNNGSMKLSQSQDTLSAARVNIGGSSISAGGTGILTVSNSATFALSGLLKVWNKGRANFDVPVSNIGNLSIVGNGIVNVNGALKINYGSTANDPIAAVASYLASGYNGGAWTGTAGIISTSAQSQSGPTLSVGYADGNSDPGTAAGPNQIVVKYTLGGDANLDGLVNFNDLVTVVQNFNMAATDWAHGNFLYGTSTNFNDLVLVVQNFNKVLPPPSGSAVSLGGSTIGIGPTDVQLPEPGIAGLAMISVAGGLRRRRRKC